MKTVIVMPAYNEAPVIAGVIRQIREIGFDEILVVDDGSNDDTPAVAKKAGGNVISHILNRGLGGALGTGLEGALKLGADIVVTLDGDGQHAANDINNVIRPIVDGEADCVIGYRNYPNSGMPFTRKMLNLIGNLVTHAFFGARVKDSQSGFRAFSSAAAGKIKIKSSRMEVSSEIIQHIFKEKLILKEIPIQAIYTDYSLSKGQNLFCGVKTFWRLLIYKLRH